MGISGIYLAQYSVMMRNVLVKRQSGESFGDIGIGIGIFYGWNLELPERIRSITDWSITHREQSIVSSVFAEGSKRNRKHVGKPTK